jgi:uncharacterized membrane protein YtjA (UPF0391 family)
MKNLALILSALSFVAGVFGFLILAGAAATLLRILFVILMVVSIVARVRTKKILKPVPGTFATSFQSEIK